jgi:peptidoglycan/LPS O-acetylase OafA/YrhL
MGDESSLVDLLFLGAALVLIVLTSVRVGRHGRAHKPAEGQRAATIGILVWLGLLAFALYLIFG